ncbi:MAG: SpoIIE family protein phosphatase [Lachnospiraceae bacterium]|nr:SpoIIE family protein phosphatase [Lachnospiraceae bacterium]
MKKILNLKIGGIQQKIYNTFLVTAVLIIAVFLSVSIYEARALGSVLTEIEKLQKDSIREITSEYLTESNGRELSQELLTEYDKIVDVNYNRAVEQSSKSTRLLLILTVLVLIACSTGALLLARRIVGPLEKMTGRISSLGGTDIAFEMEDAYRTGDEVEILAEAFAALSKKTRKYIEDITKITAEKERIGAELGMATAIQASQLPHLFPAFPGYTEFDIYASMKPAKEVGGDFYDFFLVDENHIALVMADVSGKGVPAALFMMISKILIRNRVQSGDSPGEALANVNEQLIEGNEAEMFVTVWLAILEVSTGKGIAANAGHEHPVLRRANGKYELVTYRHSPAVSLIEGASFEEHEFEMHPGDSLFVHTDGVTEATDSKYELFGTQRLLDALNKNPDAKPEQVLRNVMDGIEAFVAGAEQFDDITMLCLKYEGIASGKKSNVKK